MSIVSDNRCFESHVYRIFDCELHVLCESPRLREHIHRFTRNLAVESVDSRHTVRLAIFTVPRGGAVFCCPELGIAVTAHREEHEWVNFRRILNTLLFSASSGYDLFHACCVTNDQGHTLICAGDSGVGKTSLLIALLEAGYTMACDDLVPISRSDAHALAVPLGVSVDREVIEHFPELEGFQSDVCRFRSDDQWQWTLNLSEAFSSVDSYTRLTPTHFFFVEWGFGSQSTLQRCMRDEALWRLQLARKDALGSKARMQAPNRMESLQLAQRLVDTCSFFTLTNGCFRDTVALVNHAMAGMPAQVPEEAVDP